MIAVFLSLIWVIFIITGISSLVPLTTPVIEFRAQSIVQPAIAVSAVPVAYIMEVTTSSPFGIYAGERINVTVLIHGVNMSTNLLSKYSYVGFMFAETENGFFIFPFGNIGWLNLTSVGGGDYFARGWILYQDQETAYAFLIPSNLAQRFNATLATIETMPSIMIVDSEANLIALRDNTYFLALTLVLIAFGVLALQPVLENIFPEKDEIPRLPFIKVKKDVKQTTHHKGNQASKNKEKISKNQSVGKIEAQSSSTQNMKTEANAKEDKPPKSESEK